MFKNIFCISLLACSLSSSLEADVYAEAKGAAFRPTDSTFREIYSWSGIYGFEVTGQAWRDLYAWGSGNCLYQGGESIGSDNTTTITMVPLGLGLKYMFPYKWLDFYFGAGMLTTYVHFRDNSPYVLPSSSKWGVGGILKAGVNMLATERFFIDLFTDYSFMKVDFHNTHGGKVIRHEADLSGWSIGIGVGHRFGVNCRH